MNKVNLILKLRDMHQDLMRQGHGMKTKKAAQKRYEKARKARIVAHSVLDRLVTEGQTLVLGRTIFCSAVFGSGAYGIEAGTPIKIETVSITYFTFSSGNQVFQSDLFSMGWTKGSLDALISGLRGQTVEVAS